MHGRQKTAKAIVIVIRYNLYWNVLTGMYYGEMPCNILYEAKCDDMVGNSQEIMAMNY